MLRMQVAMLASIAPALILAAPACSDDLRGGAHDRVEAGLDAASSAEGGMTRIDGGSGSGGAPGASDGGAPGEGDGPRTGEGGSGAGGKPREGAGGAPPTGADAGCKPMDVPDATIERELILCDRLRSASVHSFNATRAYDHAVFADCRVSWVVDLYLKEDMRAEFLNSLLVWNMRLWGCTAPPPTDFGLIFEPAPLSAGDVAALIDDYLGVVIPELDLSDLEIADMRAAATSLARPLIEDPSCSYSRSSCETGTGGAGSGGAMGAGGAGNGGAMNAGGTANGGMMSTGNGGEAGSGGSGGSGGAGGSAGTETGGAGGSGGAGAEAGTPPLDAGAGGKDAASPP